MVDELTWEHVAQARRFRIGARGGFDVSCQWAVLDFRLDQKERRERKKRGVFKTSYWRYLFFFRVGCGSFLFGSIFSEMTLMVMGNVCFESILIGVARQLRDIRRRKHPSRGRRFWRIFGGWLKEASEETTSGVGTPQGRGTEGR